jgi:hypothetical protein
VKLARGPECRYCANCGVPLSWGRWCIDCTRMIGKTAIVVAVEELIRWMVR